MKNSNLQENVWECFTSQYYFKHSSINFWTREGETEVKH